MNQQLDRQALEKVVSDVVAISPRGEKPLTGRVANIITQEGRYVEAGLEFKMEDGLYTQLYCGLAVLARDMYHYPGTKNRTDAKHFMNLVEAVRDEEKINHYQNAFPSYKVVSDGTTPLDLTAAEKGEPIDLTLLSEARIIHEWNFIPGKRFLVKLSQRIDIREAVCNTAGPRDFVKNVQEGVKTAAVLKVSEAILTATFSAAAFWYPLAAYAAVYILKQTYNAYCSE